MKIRLNLKHQGYAEFLVEGLYYWLDGNENPINITLFGKEETLADIIKFARLEDYIQPISMSNERIMVHCKEATHECLIAKLPPFAILGAEYIIRILTSKGELVIAYQGVLQEVPSYKKSLQTAIESLSGIVELSEEFTKDIKCIYIGIDRYYTIN